MKKLMVAMAIAGAVGMAQASFSDLEGFENLTVGNKLSIDKSGLTWSWTAAAADIESGLLAESVITNYAGTGDQKYSEDAGYNFLALTGVERLERYVVPQDNETEAGFDVKTSTAGELYIDTLVKFTVTEDDAPTPGSEDKLCIWVGIVSNETTGVISTNLMVTAGYVKDDTGEHIDATNYVTSLTFDGETINEWHRLTVRAVQGIDDANILNGFVVSVDGTPVATETAAIDASFFNEGYIKPELATLYNEGKLFPSIIYTYNALTITSVGFKGSGAIDNLQFSETDPNPQQTGWKDASDPDVYASMTNQTAATIYPTLAGTSLANADAAKLTLWATDATKGNLAFTDAENDNVTQTTEKAYLLNCAESEVADEEAAFTVNITVAADGTPTVTATTTNTDGEAYNGKLQLKGKENLTDATWTDLNAPSTTYHFYKYVLKFEF